MVVLLAIAPVCVPTLSVIDTVPKPEVAGAVVSTVRVKAGVLSALSLPDASVVLTCNVWVPSPKVLLVGQPTRGVDIGAIEFIYSQLRAMRDAGCAVLVVSSELDEILALADRVIVMNQGRIAGELAINDCTEAGIGLLMTGGSQ